MEVVRYITAAGKDVFGEWLESIDDQKTVAKILVRIDRLEAGNFGDCKPLRSGVWELRIDWGPGYRVYYGRVGRQCVLLLCGGDKSRQSRDIDRAVEYWNDYRERKEMP